MTKRQFEAVLAINCEAFTNGTFTKEQFIESVFTSVKRVVEPHFNRKPHGKEEQPKNIAELSSRRIFSN